MSKFIIIGGGIIGTALARELARRKAGTVTILEKEARLGLHASGRNSGVIHSGINQKPGTLKAKMCVRGSTLLLEYCKKHRVPMNECGTIVVSRDQKETQTLERLLKMGNECGVPGLTMLTAKQLKAREPHAKGINAFLSPMGATVDSRALLESLAKESKSLGVKYRMTTKAIEIEGTDVHTSEDIVRGSYIINCAGLYADVIAHRMGVGETYRIIPFRGAYLEVDDCDVRSMIYRAPDLRYPFLSIHLTRETDGRVLAGPTADIAFAREAYNKQWHPFETPRMMLSRQFRKLFSDREFIKLVMENARLSFSKKAFLKEIQTLVDGVSLNQLRPYRSGIRAQMVDDKGKMVMDLLVAQTQNSLHVLNAVSPGMTCSLAFAEHLADTILN